MRRTKAIFTIILAFAVLNGCVELNLGGGTGATFVMTGVAESADENGFCFIWRADNGTDYMLYQNSRVPNADFDAAVTPGTRSRLELKIRFDLGEACQPGALVAEVTKVLEIETDDLE